jgi:hypothetical protein
MHADEFVRPVAVPSSETIEFVFTCPLSSGHGRPGTYSWPYVAPPDAALGDPLGLGLAVELPAAVAEATSAAGGRWVEYGLVERAYALAQPDDWRRLLARYDHTHYHPDGATRRQLPYTASRYLGRTLGALRAQGIIAFKQGPGTGRWSYNDTISYYAPATVADGAPTCTWERSGRQMSEYMPSDRPVG